MEMVAAVAPFVDTSIWKTVNVPEDYPYSDFEDLYSHAWRAGLKGLATYRPNEVLGAVLSVGSPRPTTDEIALDEANRRLAIKSLPAPVLASLLWPGRPSLPGGNPAWTYMIDIPVGEFALFVGHVRGRKRRQPSQGEIFRSKFG